MSVRLPMNPTFITKNLELSQNGKSVTCFGKVKSEVDP